MNEIFEKLQFYLQYQFVSYALIVGILISLCSSLLGITLVLKRFSFIGDGLSHVAFGSMAIATIIGFKNDMPITLIITIACAILLIRKGENRKISGDASIAMLSVGALALGYLLMNLFSTSSNLSGDVCSTLFGATSILTLTKTKLYLCVILSVIVVSIFLIFYNKIFAITFDENFAKAIGTKTNIYNLFIAVIIAVVIVLAMNLVGSLLISALIIFPALSSMQIFKSFRSVTICSAIMSVICSVIGILISILAGTPVGSTIVVVYIVIFIIFYLIGNIFGGIIK
ncbi:metal ABC transporter permease [Brachyspira aalborgi]|mgnify:FL=1|uniref:metal ABC transporter permease n=1 Tax=Brachyspira aalborgi TaxID=29522 RepID=UPI0018F47A44|nr:metal ABC transporter permease [Brachyspira aalborgi]